jgi:hypothetical protein
VQPLGLQPHFPVPPAATAKKKKSTFPSVALLLVSGCGHDGEQLLPHLPVSMAKL